MKTPTGSSGPTSSSRTLTHVHQATSVPVEQEEEPTLPDGPVVTPRPPVTSAGRYSRTSTEESHIASSRSSLEPPAPSGTVIAASCDFSPKSEGDTRRETVGSDSNRGHEARCSRTGSRPGVPGRGYCRPTLPTPSPADLHRRLFDPSLEYSIDQVVLFCQPPYYFSQ